MNINDQNLERLERYKRVHLNKEELENSTEEQIEALRKRSRNKWLQLIVNILAILFFSYSYYFNITQLSNTILYILFGVFVINLILIFYQKKQINELLEFMNKDKTT